MRSIDCSTGSTIAALCGLMVLSAFGASASALPPDPDNAALVYYRAYLLRPGPDHPWPESLDRFIDGNESLENVKQELSLRAAKIRVIETAARMPKCDWGLQYSKGLGHDAPHFQMMTQFAWLLRADGQRLAAEGQCRAALERCLTIRRLGRHVGAETPLAWLAAGGINRRAEVGIQHVLGIMPPSVDTLAWLKTRLSEEPRPLLPLDQALKMDLELALQSLRTNASILARVREELVEKAGDENTKRQAKDWTDEELIVRAKRGYTSFLDAALQTIRARESYRETYTHLQDLRQQLDREHGSDPTAKQVIDACADQTLNCYNSGILFTASSRALDAAVEVYLAIAKTGHVPPVPPESVPKDPYSNQDFEYEVTKDGFLFRCHAPDLAKGAVVRPFEFRVYDSSGTDTKARATTIPPR